MENISWKTHSNRVQKTIEKAPLKFSPWDHRKFETEQVFALSIRRSLAQIKSRYRPFLNNYMSKIDPISPN